MSEVKRTSSAVYTAGREKGKWTPLSGGFHNEVFHQVERNEVIRLSAPMKMRESVCEERDWMTFLAANGVPLPNVHLVEEMDNGRVVTVFDYIKGEAINVTDPAHWNNATYEEMGQIAGRMHALSKKYGEKAVLRPCWSVDEPDVFSVRDLLPVWARDKYDLWMKRLASFERTPDIFGLIHNDYHQGNLLATDSGLVVIDFDDCAYNWFAQDIAVCFYHAYWQHDSFNGETDVFVKTFLNHFMSGYRREQPIDPSLIKQIPIFLKLREMYLYSIFIRSWNKDTMEEWQHFTLRDLEEKIQNEVPYAGIEDFASLWN